MNWLNLYDSFININLSDFYTYFTTKFVSTEPLSDENPAVLVVTFEHSLDRITQIRVVYGVLDFLSDIGGMEGILLLIGGMMV